MVVYTIACIELSGTHLSSAKMQWRLMSTAEHTGHTVFKRHLRQCPFLKQPGTAIFDRNDSSQLVLIQLQENVHPWENLEFKDQDNQCTERGKKAQLEKKWKLYFQINWKKKELNTATSKSFKNTKFILFSARCSLLLWILLFAISWQEVT